MRRPRIGSQRRLSSYRYTTQFDDAEMTMKQRRETKYNEHVKLANPSEPDRIRDGLGELPASNEPAVAVKRIRALDALAQCMQYSALGG
jgi:hypothetical protein